MKKEKIQVYEPAFCRIDIWLHRHFPEVSRSLITKLIREGKIKLNGEIIDTNTDFFGSIIGDSSRMGANSTAVPGTFIGPYTWILPTVQVRGFVPAEKRVFPKAEYMVTENPKVELK